MAAVFGGFPAIPTEDVLVFRTPSWGGNERVPFIAIGDDFGDLVHGILLSPADKYGGKLVQAFSDARTPQELVASFERLVGKKARYEVMPDGPDGIETYGMSALITVKEMFAWVYAAGGNYYAEPNDINPAQELKRLAVAAQGGDEAGATLVTVEHFWQHIFMNA